MSDDQKTSAPTMTKYGSRSEVWSGLASQTRGKLTKNDLMISRTGRIVSKKKSAQARSTYEKYGFKTRTVAEPEPEAQPKQKRRRRKKVVVT